MRIEVASNSNIPVRYLEKLAQIEVAKNPNTPLDIFKRLVSDSDPIVRTEIVKNPNIILSDPKKSSNLSCI